MTSIDIVYVCYEPSSISQLGRASCCPKMLNAKCCARSIALHASYLFTLGNVETKITEAKTQKIPFQVFIVIVLRRTQISDQYSYIYIKYIYWYIYVQKKLNKLNCGYK